MSKYGPSDRIEESRRVILQKLKLTAIEAERLTEYVTDDRITEIVAVMNKQGLWTFTAYCGGGNWSFSQLEEKVEREREAAQKELQRKRDEMDRSLREIDSYLSKFDKSNKGGDSDDGDQA